MWRRWSFPTVKSERLVSRFHSDIQVGAEVVFAHLLRELLEVDAISRHEINLHIGCEITHLLHDCLQVKKIPTRADAWDDDNDYALRKFCLVYHGIRAVIIEVAA
jgi:GTP pyrophosphokinase